MCLNYYGFQDKIIRKLHQLNQYLVDNEFRRDFIVSVNDWKSDGPASSGLLGEVWVPDLNEEDKIYKNKIKLR